LKHLKQNPAGAWPVTTKQKHENESLELQKQFKVIIILLSSLKTIVYGLYGSFMFDGVVFEDKFKNYVDKVIDTIDRSEADKIKLFDDITAIFTSEILKKSNNPKNVV